MFKELVGAPKMQTVDIVRNNVTLKLDGVMRWRTLQGALHRREVSLNEVNLKTN